MPSLPYQACYPLHASSDIYLIGCVPFTAFYVQLLDTCPHFFHNSLSVVVFTRCRRIRWLVSLERCLFSPQISVWAAGSADQPTPKWKCVLECTAMSGLFSARTIDGYLTCVGFRFISSTFFWTESSSLFVHFQHRAHSHYLFCKWVI